MRRALLRLGLAGLLVALAAQPTDAVQRTEPVVVTLFSDTAGSPAARTARDGALLGFEEAAHTFRVLGRELVMRETSDPIDAAGLVVSIASAAPHRSGALVVDGRARHAATGCADALVFRIGNAADPADDTQLWPPPHERFGAAQLNERFHRRFGYEMTDDAWAGWLAVKVVTESVLRARTTDPAVLSEWLGGAAAIFDGHKGAPLRFNAARRLAHPRYRVLDDQPEPVTLPNVGECDA